MAEDDRLTRVVQLLRNGQMTIPAEFRRRLGITGETMLLVTLEERELRVTPVEATETAAGSAWFKDLYDFFAPVREEAKAHSEEDIDAAIDEAVRAVRKSDARGL
jgi:AbrB family looped-hinge helix DNA binding protein